MTVVIDGDHCDRKQNDTKFDWFYDDDDDDDVSTNVKYMPLVIMHNFTPL